MTMPDTPAPPAGDGGAAQCEFSVPIVDSDWSMVCGQSKGHDGAHIFPSNPQLRSPVSEISGAALTGIDARFTPVMLQSIMAERDDACARLSAQEAAVARLTHSLLTVRADNDALYRERADAAAEIARLREALQNIVTECATCLDDGMALIEVSDLARAALTPERPA